jgi:hypothetical protein
MEKTMQVSCEKCFFCKGDFCRVNPPDPMLDALFPKISADKYPCGEYLDRESGLPIEEVLKRNAMRQKTSSFRPQGKEFSHANQNPKNG